MTGFNPTYMPDIVKFIIVHDNFEPFISRMDPRYQEMAKELGLQISLQRVKEPIIPRYLGYQLSASTQVNNDCIIFLHGILDGRAGVEAAQDLSETGARFIVTLDWRVKTEIQELVDHISAYNLMKLGILDPKAQVSVIADQDKYYPELTYASGRIREYFKAMAALRGPQ